MRTVAEGLEARVFLNAGDPDATFGHSQPVVTPGFTGQYEAYASSVAAQADGKIVTAGDITAGPGGAFLAVARYNPDGSPDSSFGSAGRVNTGDVVQFAARQLVAVQPDGKIVLAATTPGGDFEVARLNPDGSPDLSFNGTGLVVADFGATDTASALTVAPDGTIVVAGSTGSSTVSSVAILRLNADGSRDTAFGPDGQVVTSLNPTATCTVTALGCQSDDKLLAVAHVTRGTTAIIRYNSDGSLDNSFGGTGIVYAVYGGLAMYAGALEIQANGQIVLGGDWDLMESMYRLNPNGTVDTTFGSGGMAYVNPFAPHIEDSYTAFVFQADGKFVAAALYGEWIMLCRLNANGTIDTSYSDGINNTPGAAGASLGGYPGLEAMTDDPDGSIASVSYESSQFYGGSWVPEFATVRWASTGGLDRTFAAGWGYAFTAFNGLENGGFSTVVQAPDGEIVAGGAFNESGTDGIFVARYDSDGTPDASFGDNGTELVNLGGTGASLAGLAVLPDGQIVLGGSMATTLGGYVGIYVARLNSDGRLDGTFGTNGVSTTFYINRPQYDVASAFGVDGNGNLIVAGSVTDDGVAPFEPEIALARFLPNGKLDSTFGNSGIVLTTIGAGSSASALAIAGDGSIFIGAQTPTTGTPEDYALIHYLSNGALDSSFGSGGISTGAVGSSASPFSAIALEGNGDIVAAGTAYGAYGSANSPAAFVLRFLPSGTLDSGFGAGGVVQLDIAPVSLGLSTAIEADGKIVIAGGTSSSYTAPRTPFLARLDVDGSPDTTFGINGMVELPAPHGPSDQWSNITFDSQGRILAAGTTTPSNGFGVGVLGRYLATEPAQITGRVFNDSNNDGLLDGAETGLAWTTVYLDANGNGQLDPGELSTTTDSAGNYVFSNLPAGSYSVRALTQSGYAQTAPLGYATQVTIAAGQPAAGPIFGQTLISSVPMNFAYLTALAQHYNQPGTFADGDLNGDGTVNFADLVILAQNYGHALTSPAATNVASASFDTTSADLQRLTELKSRKRRIRRATARKGETKV